mmetsp:Transcript_125661/g.351932  ORF Transcript_125661/g.351932 Transcript_125661/m.351932 type:complete len:131 (-) Transcript_125661:295-687(-)
MDDFKDSPTSLVADVDCTTEGKDLCEKHGIQGYPSIKYGDPAELKDYSGGRSYADLKKFASENLGPTCGPGENIELCDAETRKKIEGYVAMSVEKLEAKVQKVIKNFEVEVPAMKKVSAYLKKTGGGAEM